MKRILPMLCVLMMVAPVLGQQGGGNDLLDELWNMQDATPVAEGTMDLRMTLGWVTEGAPANLGDSDDDFVLQPSLVWGTCPNVQLTLSVPIWLGDGGDIGATGDGNGDSYINLLWKFADQDGKKPAMAMSGTARIPTGHGSDGIDGELRLILTNSYDSGIRSHMNFFVFSSNTDNDQGLRDFQWGGVIGLDGPLCSEGAVRWVIDYMHRSSEHDGQNDMDLIELGWEWSKADSEKFGMSLQIGADRAGDTPNFGARFSYSKALQH